MNIDFWKGCLERAVKTFVQTFIATLGVTIGATYAADDFMGLPWTTALITAAVAAVLSVATSLGNVPFVSGATAPVVAPGDPGMIALPDDPTGLIDPDDGLSGEEEAVSEESPRHSTA